MTSRCPFRRTSFPSLGDTSGPLVVFAPWRTSGPPRPGVDHPVSPAGMLPRKQQDLPSSWGTSVIRLPCSKPTPAGLIAPDHKVQQRGPWSSKGRGSRDWVFRRSIAWLSDSLRAPCAAWSASQGRLPDTTQDSLPVAGQALLDGILTRKVPMKGFKVVITSHSPFPSFLGAIDATSVSNQSGYLLAVFLTSVSCAYFWRRLYAISWIGDLTAER